MINSSVAHLGNSAPESYWQGVSTLPTGTVLTRSLQIRAEQRYFLYLPRNKRLEDCPVFVSVHGISRNAKNHARFFAKFADQYGVVLVAPLFDKALHPRYQRFGFDGLRSDIMLQLICAEVAQLTNADISQLYMFGYSGGGQFVHRYAMAYPEQVASLVIGAAGWYTFPNPSRAFPYGIQAHRKLQDLHFDLEKFLHIPATVLVGERDTERDEALRKTQRLDREQGSSRFIRGQRWIAAMQDAAEARGINTRYQFESLPESDHSFSRCVRRGGLCGKVFQNLFDA